jgi:lipoprotein-anchoring transpeptidase ErfK/SrfK
MRQKSFIIAAAAVAILLLGAVGVYAYDSSRQHVIAKGVTVGGVPVGGMHVDKAERVVQRAFNARLDHPVTVAYNGRSFQLSPRSARLRADVPTMVQDALHVSRDGNVVSRVVRDITGGAEKKDVATRIAYSHAAVRRFVTNIKRSVDRKAVDAHLAFPSVRRLPGHNGLEVNALELERGVDTTLTTPYAEHVIRPPMQVTKPKVGIADLPTKYSTLLVLNRSAFRLSLYQHLHPVKSYTVAVGQQGLDTPAGIYHIQDKEVNPSWQVPNSSWAGSLAGQTIPGGAPNNPLKARWLGIANGVGIHGTAEDWSIGSRASHGCIRMHVSDVVDLFRRVPVGTPVLIR